MPLCTILAKCPAPTGPACTKPDSPALGLERVEDRHGRLDVLGRAADHQAVPVLLAPDAAGDADVEVADALLGEQRGVRAVVGVPRVAAVDDDVAGLEQRGQLVDGRARSARRRAPSPRRRGARPAPAASVGQRLDVGRPPGCGRSRPPRGRPRAAARACCRPSCRARPDRAACQLPAFVSDAAAPRAGSAREPDGHQQVQVAGYRSAGFGAASASVAGGRRDRSDQRRPLRRGERQPGAVGVQHAEPVEQVAGVERDQSAARRRTRSCSSSSARPSSSPPAASREPVRRRTPAAPA